MVDSKPLKVSWLWLLVGAFAVLIVVNVVVWVRYVSFQKQGKNSHIGVKVESVVEIPKVQVINNRINKLVGEWSMGNGGMLVRTIPGAMNTYPVEKLKLIIDNNRYRFDLQYASESTGSAVISSAEETLVGSTLTVRVGVDESYMRTLSSEKAEEFITKAIVKSLVTLSRKHKTTEQLKEDIGLWTDRIMKTGWLVEVK